MLCLADWYSLYTQSSRIMHEEVGTFYIRLGHLLRHMSFIMLDQESITMDS